MQLILPYWTKEATEKIVEPSYWAYAVNVRRRKHVQIRYRARQGNNRIQKEM
jgi:hypothetical protein